MKCPHCGDHFHDHWSRGHVIHQGNYTLWYYGVTKCASLTCGKHVVMIGDGPLAPGAQVPDLANWKLVFPRGASRGPVPTHVPAEIASDYTEAAEVLPISSKASAALARRCLQNVLHAHGYRDRDLYREIGLLINETDPRKAIPESLRTIVDGIRHFGNFSAHPVTDVTTLQVIDVEPHEAEWCLDILDELFEHFYVKPAQAAARKAQLDAKLALAGKPPSL